MLLIFLFFCDVFFDLFVFILCLVPNVACVSVLTIPEQLSSAPIFSGICIALSIVFYVVLCRLLVFVSFGHYVVCSSSIYRFWLPLSYLQTPLSLLVFSNVYKNIPFVLWISQQTLKFTINPYLPIIGIQLKAGRFLVVSLSWLHNTDRIQSFQNNLHMLLDVHIHISLFLQQIHLILKLSIHFHYFFGI